ncbi:MAG: molybdopterin molybdenumtransferase MoeA [Paracoccaceae bacterium]|nr:MAG: molybdopterin molybdenumtransferase MoeA [Paracoccaceae bacterium]
MLTVAEALGRVLAMVPRMGEEEVPLAEAAGRVLARPVRAQRSQPPFAASAMDGYALRAADAGPRRVIGTAAAGRGFAGRVGPGEAVRIFTGAPLPEGADSILIQEEAERAGDMVLPRAAPAPGAHVRPAGCDFRAGQEVAAPRRIGAHLLALLAAMNLPRLPVARRPVVAIIPTGDELVWPGESPGPDQIVTSNNFGIAAIVAAQGGIPRLLPIARDDPAALGAALGLAAGADMIVTLGGASVGAHDLVQDALRAAGMELSFWKIAMRPGKPLLAGRLGQVPVLGLPGNPVSALVCAHLFLRPAIDAALGLPAGPLPRRRGILDADLGPNGPREHYLRARREGDRIIPFPDQDSSLLSVLSAADVLAIHPAGGAAMSRGSCIEYIELAP